MKKLFKNLIDCYIIPEDNLMFQYDSGDLHLVQKSMQSQTVIVKNLRTKRTRHLHFDNNVNCKIVTKEEYPEYFI